MPSEALWLSVFKAMPLMLMVPGSGQLVCKFFSEMTSFVHSGGNGYLALAKARQGKSYDKEESCSTSATPLPVHVGSLKTVFP